MKPLVITAMKKILSLCIFLWCCSAPLLGQEKDSLLWTAVQDKNTARALELIEAGADAGPVAADLGQQLMELGRFADAATYLHRALDHQVATNGKDNADYGNRLNKLGEVYYFLGQYDQALAYFDQAMKNAEKHLGKEHADYGDRISNLGAIYWQLGRHQEALPLFREVVEIAAKTIGKEDPGYADRLSNLGFLYRELGQYDQALPLFYEALQITERTLGKDDHSYAVRLNNLAFLYRQMGQYEKALPLQRQGLQALDPQHPEYGRQLSNLGILYRLLGRYEEALPVQQQALENTAANEGKEHQNYGLRLNNMAVLLRQMGRYEEALPLQLQAADQVEGLFGTEHPDYGRRQLQLAILYRLMEKYEPSRAAFEKAMPVLEKTLGQDHPEYADALIEQAVMFEQTEDAAAAADAYRQAHHLALQRIHQSFDQFSEQEQAAMWNTLEHHFAHIQSFALQHPNFEDLRGLSLNANLTVKGLLLNSRQRLLAGLREVQDPSLREQFAEWEYLKNWLARQYSRPVGKRLAAFDSLENRAAELESELARRSAPFREARTQASWEEIQAALGEGEAAIEFARFRYHHKGQPTDTVLYCAYLVQKKARGPEMITLFPERMLQDLLGEETTRKLDYVNQLYTYSGRGVIAADDSPELYTLLWQPLETRLRKIRSIYFSPDGLLHRITLAAIPVGEEEILADRYALHLLGSTRQLLYPASAQEDPRRGRAAIFGGVVYEWDSTAYSRPTHTQVASTKTVPPPISRGGEKWDYLKWTDREVEAISGLLEQEDMQADVYRGYAAREEAFKRLGQQESSPAIIHLATHGYFFPDPDSYALSELATDNVFRWSEHPMVRAGLILAGANRVWEGESPVEGYEDGVLTAYEIAQLDLQNTELVVLSACETGLGDIEGNEGVYGLQRAFRIAGARYLIMSLWQVPDKETAYFMESFYRNLLEEKMSIPDAFRTTQKELRENPFITPYQWAGFVLVE